MEDNSKKINEGFSGSTKNFFNLNFVKKDQDKFIFSCSFPDACANPMGFVQGGMISAVLDDATSIAMISSYENKKAPLTTDLHVLFHRPLDVDEAKIEVSLIKMGNRSATAEGRIFNKSNKLAATLLHTAQPVDAPNQ
jgi:uncharacterized protein (TIGR00369 family)